MKQPIRRKWIRILQLILAIYCVTGIVLWQLQDALLFHPTPLALSYNFKFEQPHRELLIPLTETDNLDVVQFFPSDTLHTKGIVLYFHGNRENIKRYAPYAKTFTDAGYEIWMLDYPGYGKTSGKRTEERFYADADLLYKMASKRISSDSIVIYGKSLGTGVASELASRRICKRLILETPYYSIPSLAGFHFPIYPTSRMTRFKFPNYAYLPQVRAPITVFQGTDDRIIPYKHALKLKATLKPGDEFITIYKGTHNDLPSFKRYQNKLKQIL